MNLPLDFDLKNFDKCRLLVVGDLMIDEYVWGDVDRISPEAPVPVVAVNSEDFTLGGSGNVVNNLVALGADVSVLGVVGTGRNGQQLLNKLSDLGSNTEGVIQEAGRPTTKKTRIIAEHQQVLRIDRESKKNIAAKTFAAISASAEKLIPEVDVILVSDYGKGLITRDLIVKLVSLAKANGKITIADPKGLNFSKYAGISLLTPNKKEACLASGVEIINEESLASAGNVLLENSGTDNLLITCGKQGMVYFEPGHRPFTISTKAREVYDVSGAGDTVIAVLGLGIAAGLSYKEAVALANTAAGIVVGKVGTATATRRELGRALQQTADSTVSKHKSIKELAELSRKLHNDRKRIVLTNGCFDLLHTGHIKLFAASKRLGDVMIVALDDDDSVRRLKGANRPVISAAERVGILSALDSVDYVIVFATNELDDVIKTIRPDVLTKGSDYDSEKVAGRKIVENYGGRVELVPITEEISSSQIINNIKNKSKPDK
ncbi:D-glycero-beta-D-manno-heptose 1-phosphate adenylyltransferase (EC / D-glycero-beta-D-manno-heptose-7-phosphate kinase (EC [Olavius sp. associated proteobacterium Delta 1]|nr:D-glycero-beta-D-manno-heptose 1-phosphate adenylyltransferase (EC / D-glycero-beta-D-manno-heptose-7-phosphate kinase (EC [Olavius sp. associated proteobacterium Delta 1]